MDLDVRKEKKTSSTLCYALAVLIWTATMVVMPLAGIPSSTWGPALLFSGSFFLLNAGSIIHLRKKIATLEQRLQQAAQPSG